MLTEWELWACANKLVETHGADAPIFAAMRIDALAEDEDDTGVANWRVILVRISNLLALPTGAPN